MRRGMAESGDVAVADGLTPKEQAEVDAMRREMVSGIIRQWKLNKALKVDKQLE
jgi:hypothetical protein